ncbi:hypothetical protein BH23BAC3_BH23BAC3_24270 [soil metagenome]
MNKESQYLKKLYPLSLELQDLAPWQWMHESELFGIQIPDSDTFYFASVMGSIGQFFAVSFYEGVRAADQFLRIQDLPDDARPDDILLLPHLMVSFDEKKYLEHNDKQRIKQYGYSLKDRKKWPMFQQVIPGHPYIFPESAKLKDLIPLLEQTLVITKRARKEEFAYIERSDIGFNGLFRMLKSGSNTGWSDEFMEVPVYSEPAAVPKSIRKVEQLNRIPGKNLVLEVELAMIPNPVMDRKPPYFPFILLLVDKESGYIYHFEILTPHPSVDEMVAGSGVKLLEILIEQKIHPQEIQVRSERLHPVLKKVLTGTSVFLSYQRRLPALEAAMESLMDFMK